MADLAASGQQRDSAFRRVTNRRRAALAVTLILIATLLTGQAEAQTETIRLSIALYPGFDVNAPRTQAIFDDFEAAHPGVEVVPVVPDPVGYFAHPADSGFEAYLQGLEDIIPGFDPYIRQADVLFMFSGELTVEATHAGYVLDLLPLAHADAELDTSDFYPGAWESFQWDGGLWAFPTAARPVTWIYDPAAFDAAGLSAPDEDWTIADFDHALRTLAEQYPAGFYNFIGDDLLLKAFLPDPLYDGNVIPNSPQLQSDPAVALIETIAALEESGALSMQLPAQNAEAFPLQLTDYLFIVGQENQRSTVNWQFAPLPGNRAGAEIQSFVVNAGTAHPELAYELIKYLSTQPEIFISSGGGMLPVRRSLLPLMEDFGYFQSYQLEDERYETVLSQMETIIPFSEMRFTEDLSAALYAVLFEDQAVDAALFQKQQAAEQNLEDATAYRETLNLAVNPLEAATDSELTLRFGVSPFVASHIIDEQWDQLNALFNEQTAQSIYVEVMTIDTLDEASEDFDCFYELFDVSALIGPTEVLELTPLIDADAAFTQEDLLPQVWTTLQDDNAIYGYPIALYPQVLWALPDFSPVDAEWTTEQFTEAFQNHQDLQTNTPFLVINGFDNAPVMMLAASFGVVTLDDPAAVEALKQVLDPIRTGEFSNPFLQTSSGGINLSAPLIADSLLNASLYTDQGYVPLLYPRNSSYSPVAFSTGYGFISAGTDQALIDACYTWFGVLAEHSQVLSGLPVTRSVDTWQGDDASHRLYEALVARLVDPTVVVFAGQLEVVGNTELQVRRLWLDQALRRYITDETTLETALAELQQQTEDYRRCMEDTDEPQREVSCALTIDPTLEGDPILAGLEN
jgi:ABC-type glycerol-3-phosphate transport system substrate-binding protein